MWKYLDIYVKIIANLKYIRYWEDKTPIKIWYKVFMNGPSKICGRQPLKIWRDMVCLSRGFLLYSGGIEKDH